MEPQAGAVNWVCTLFKGNQIRFFFFWKFMWYFSIIDRITVNSSFRGWHQSNFLEYNEQLWKMIFSNLSQNLGSPHSWIKAQTNFSSRYLWVAFLDTVRVICMLWDPALLLVLFATVVWRMRRNHFSAFSTAVQLPRGWEYGILALISLLWYLLSFISSSKRDSVYFRSSSTKKICQ